LGSVENGKSRGPGRPKRGREHDSEALLAAALSSFAEHGFEKSSLRTIASKAGIDVALISYRYGSKLGLWTAVVDLVAEDSIVRINAISAQNHELSPTDRLEQLCAGLVELIAERPLFAQLLITEIMTTNEGERQALIAQKLAQPVYAILLEYLTALRSETVQGGGMDDGLSILASISMIGVLVSTRPFLSRLSVAASDEKALKIQLTALMMRMLQST
jgi:AcrR family transcriptional regulator